MADVGQSDDLNKVVLERRFAKAGYLSSQLPPGVGIGFKSVHFDALIEGRHRPSFLEVHAENYMGDGGLPLRQLEQLRERFALSLHGVGLSIGGEDPVDRGHLDRLRQLIERYRPHSFSEHLAWSSHGLNAFNDLLPLAYNRVTLGRVCEHINEVQDALKMQLLLENPATYVEFASSSYGEIEFLQEIVRRTGCGLLLDVNNVQVSSINHARNPFDYLDAFPIESVGEIHLGGHSEEADEIGGRLLIDSHDRLVDPEVWALFARILHRLGPISTLIEWDQDVPELEVLMGEVDRAETILNKFDARQKPGRRKHRQGVQ